MVSLCRSDRRRRSLSILAVVALSLTTFGCSKSNRSEGEAYANAGIAASNNLGDYYDSLAQDAVDTWEMEAFNSALRKLPFDEKEYARLLNALRTRARMARSLGSVYIALKQLSTYDASGEVKGAATDLAGAISGLLDLSNGPDASGIFGNVAGDFAGAAQSRSIRRAVELGTAILEKLKELQVKERKVYISIPEERFNKMASISDHLIDEKLVAGAPLLRSVPQTLGTFFVDEKKPFEGQDTKNGLKETARARLAKMRLLSLGATDAAEGSVKELITQSHKLTASQSLDLTTLRGFLDKTASYLDQIAKLRKGSEEEEKKP